MVAFVMANRPDAPVDASCLVHRGDCGWRLLGLRAADVLG